MQLSRTFIAQDAIFRFSTSNLNRFFPRKLNVRKSSFPLLSPDTYLELCERSILSDADLIEFIKESKKNLVLESVYIAGELVEALISKIDELNNINIKRLIIMESDTKQNTKELNPLLTVASQIFSNNLVGNQKDITPIPLGLERRAYRSAGVIRHFKKNYSIDPRSRRIDFLVAWNDETNSMRKKYRELFIKSEKGLVINRRMHPRSIHKLMRKSLFVPSPAGNGLDCHRTWEALYLGAVPVVLKSEFCGDSTWPVLVIDHWDEIIKLSRPEMEEIYISKRKIQNEALEFSNQILKKVSSHAK
jgi:hypothetical protein